MQCRAMQTFLKIKNFCEAGKLKTSQIMNGIELNLLVSVKSCFNFFIKPSLRHNFPTKVLSVDLGTPPIYTCLLASGVILSPPEQVLVISYLIISIS